MIAYACDTVRKFLSCKMVMIPYLSASSAASSGTGDDDWDGAQKRMEREREAIENDANLIESVSLLFIRNTI